MKHKFKEIDDFLDKLSWCMETFGPHAAENSNWRWGLAPPHDSGRIVIMIQIEKDDMAMAYKIRWT